MIKLQVTAIVTDNKIPLGKSIYNVGDEVYTITIEVEADANKQAIHNISHAKAPMGLRLRGEGLEYKVVKL